MYQVSREINFCYGHRLLNYDGKCRHLHGHNGKLRIVFAGETLDECGMLLDFAEIKRVVSQWIDDHLDHRMILHRNDPVVAMLLESGEPLFLLDTNPTAENIARVVFDYAAEKGFPVVEVRLWETPNCSATYCPSDASAHRIVCKDPKRGS